MEITIKHYNDLSKDELFELLKLRTSIFIVEQNCPYQDIDEIDKTAFHVYLKDSSILSYLRIYQTENDVRIGRVLSTKRRCGYASYLLKESIQYIKTHFHTSKIVLEAQVYAKELYKKQGFIEVSDIFLEDDIPHVRMELTL